MWCTCTGTARHVIRSCMIAVVLSAITVRRFLKSCDLLFPLSANATLPTPSMAHSRLAGNRTGVRPIHACTPPATYVAPIRNGTAAAPRWTHRYRPRAAQSRAPCRHIREQQLQGWSNSVIRYFPVSADAHCQPNMKLAYDTSPAYTWRGTRWILHTCAHYAARNHASGAHTFRTRTR